MGKTQGNVSRKNLLWNIEKKLAQPTTVEFAKTSYVLQRVEIGLEVDKQVLD